MSRDAKWYANWVRLLPASSADEKMRNLEAADMLEDLDKRVPRWISVEERLPEEIHFVAVYIKEDAGAFWIETAFRRDGKWRTYGEYVIDRNITHWMPLPEPPEEGV